MNLLRRMLKEKRPLIVPLAIAAIGNVLLYALVVFPLSRQVVNAERQAREEREVLRRARQDYQTAKATIEGKQQADAALQKFYKDILPADASAARRVTYLKLSQLAKAANVHLEHGVNEVRAEKGSSLSRLTTSYALSGDYSDVRQFIYSLETAPEFMVLERISLSSTDQRDRGLVVNLDVATYFRTGNAG